MGRVEPLENEAVDVVVVLERKINGPPRILGAQSVADGDVRRRMPAARFLELEGVVQDLDVLVLQHLAKRPLVLFVLVAEPDFDGADRGVIDLVSPGNTALAIGVLGLGIPRRNGTRA